MLRFSPSAGQSARATGPANNPASVPLLVDALRAKALVLTQQKEWPDALETLEEGLSLTRAMRYPYAEARMLYAYGVMYAHKGEPEEERQRLEEALVIFRRLEARPYIERTEETLAELQ